MLIRVIDLETTGFDPPEHAVIEIGWCDLVSTRVDLAGLPTGWEVTDGGSMIVNPGRPIPAESSAVHHLVDEDVASGFAWRDVVPLVLQVPGIDAFAAHNTKLERAFITDDLTGNVPWIDSYKVALRLLPDAVPHSNQVCRYTMNPAGLDRSIADRAHRAYPDAYVTAHLLRDFLQQSTVEQMLEWTRTPALLARVPFGVHRGKKWSDPAVDDGLLTWTLGKDFSEDVLFTARHELDRREKEREERWRQQRSTELQGADQGDPYDDGRPF